MAYAGGTAGANASETNRSSLYRVKFEREEFLGLVNHVQSERIYKIGRMHFFAFDGFVMYTVECEEMISDSRYFTL